MRLIIIICVTIMSFASYSEASKTDTLLCNIEKRIYDNFLYSFRVQDITKLTELDSLLEINENKQLSTYWKSYNQYYQSLYYLKNGNRELSQKKIETAITQLELQADKDSETYALIAFLQNYSIQFVSSVEIGELKEKINKNANEAVKLDNENLRAWYVLGNFDLHLPASYGGGQKCEEYLLKAISLKENSKEDCRLPMWGKNQAYYSLVSYYNGVGKTKKAQKKLKQGLEQYPDDYMLNRLKDKIEE
ncbi:hypothetical protein [Carboxylicivirga taeanensis]|uniref:hypothetical protein n=1 Tax=Carboxylicivirga taeanensis TaxID=1416875 RepID=UPI003F6DE5DE